MSSLKIIKSEIKKTMHHPNKSSKTRLHLKKVGFALRVVTKVVARKGENANARDSTPAAPTTNEEERRGSEKILAAM
jgi:hypothetical protein